MIVVENVFLKKGGNVLLNDVSFSIKEGDLVLLPGIPGSQKSLLLKVICGLVKPTTGKIIIDGQENPRHNRKKISYLPQHFSIKENVSGRQFAENYVILNHYGVQDDALVTIIKVFTKFDKLELLEKHLPDLTLLEIRIFMMLLLLCSNSKIIVIDEPQSDEVQIPSEFYEKYIAFLKERKITTILASRIRNIMKANYDSLLLLHQGWVAYNAYWEQIKKNLNHYNIRIRPAKLAKYFKKYPGFEKAVYIESTKAMDVILKSNIDPYKIIMAFIKNNIKFDLVEIFKPDIKQFLEYKLEEFNIVDKHS
ncbi:MAG: ATP-binding cassette domain-containing protein [Calditrichia bacterium]|nr:ATP-binding cassette domain-containing protein [Calditrichia bacterium]